MKKYKFIMILISIVITMSFVQGVVMNFFLPNYKGKITSHKAITSQSLALDKNIVTSLWIDYSESLPSFASKQDDLSSYDEESEKEFIKIVGEMTEKGKPKDLKNIFQSMKYDGQNGKSIFLKDYEYQTIDENTFIFNYIHSRNNDGETIYCYVQPKTEDKVNRDMQDKIISYLNKVNENGYQSLYFEDLDTNSMGIKNPFLKMNQVIKNTIKRTLYPSAINYNDNLMSAHFYTMADENEIFIIYQPSDENQDISLILIFNIELQDISGFILSRK